MANNYTPDPTTTNTTPVEKTVKDWLTVRFYHFNAEGKREYLEGVPYSINHKFQPADKGMVKQGSSPADGTVHCDDMPCDGSYTVHYGAPRGEEYTVEALVRVRVVNELKVEKCPEKVEFKEAPATIYGFDDYSVPAVPWKSVEKGKKDTIIAKITPTAKFSCVEFICSDTSKATVAPIKAASGIQTLTIKGVNNGETEVKAMCNGTELGKFQVKTYTKKTKTVAVRLVHETNYMSTDIKDVDIKQYLKKFYNQAVFEFRLIRLPAKTINFDLDKNGQLDVESWMSTEMIEIRDACKDPKYDYNIFIVDKPSDDSLGFMGFSQQYGFVHADSTSPPEDAITVAHELGHGAFGLQHPDQNGDNDKDNLMHSDETGTSRLRKNQWDIINP